MNNKKDYRQDITNNIIKLMEEGNAPWQKPWDKENAINFYPYNAATQRKYNGGNAIYLMCKAINKFNSNDPRWCTLKQANEKGWKIKSGSKGTQVEYWKDSEKIKIIDKETVEIDEVIVKTKPKVFYATVFHASQIEGIPEHKIEIEKKWDTIEYAENIIKKSGAEIKHDQLDKAYYSPVNDDIHLPRKETFKNALNYYEVALHELAHWSGHESRLNRNLSGKFGSESYAKEELRAQISSLYLAIETGVPFSPENHAGYNSSWIKVLKGDKNEFFRAARDAEKISDFIINLANIQENKNDNLVTAMHSLGNALNEFKKSKELLENYIKPSKIVTLDDFYKNEANKLLKTGFKYPEIDFKIADSLLNKSKNICKSKTIIAKYSPEMKLKDNKNKEIYLDNLFKNVTKNNKIAR